MTIKEHFNKYFYGDPNKTAFTENDLPSTRIKLFKAVLSVRWGNMIALNLLYLAAWIPAVLWTILNLFEIFKANIEQIASILFSYLLILCPLITITGPFTAGISYVIRNWARDEHSLTFTDFFYGMKSNWLQSTLQSTISGAIPIVMFASIYTYSKMTLSPILYCTSIAMLLVASLIWTLAVQIMPTMAASYKLSFRAIIKNALLISVITLPRSIGIKLLTLFLPLLMFIVAFIFPSALKRFGAFVFIAYLLFMLSFNKLVQASFSNYVCEKYLNTLIEGAEVDIGLHRSKNSD